MVENENTENSNFGQCVCCKRKIKKRGKVCTHCRNYDRKKKAEQKKEEQFRLLNRKCKQCGNLLNSKDKRRVVCSKECGFAFRRLKRFEVRCCQCHKLVQRTESQIKSRSKFCCSLHCQRLYALETNRGKPQKTPLSIRLPVVWLCECGQWNSRPKCENKNCIDRQCKAQLAKLIAKRKSFEEMDKWNYAIGLRLHSNKGRKGAGKTSREYKATSVENELRKLACKRFRFESCEWEKRIANKLSNMRKRRRRIRGKKNGDSSGGKTEVGRPAIQMRFDWMATESRELCY